MSDADADLVRRCLGRDEEAFRLLVRRHQKNVYWLVWRIVQNTEDARDITQETFVKVFRSLDRFDPSRRFPYWISRIATNTALDFLRSRKRMESLDAEPEEGRKPLVLVDPKPTPDEDSEQERSLQRLEGLVNRLSPQTRAVIHLRHVQQLSYDEIAEILNVPLGTVRSRLHRGQNQLRAWMENQERAAGAGHEHL